MTVSQRYQNTLEESCAVCRFEVEIGGKRIVGKIEEREQAFEKSTRRRSCDAMTSLEIDSFTGSSGRYSSKLLTLIPAARPS